MSEGWVYNPNTPIHARRQFSPILAAFPWQWAGIVEEPKSLAEFMTALPDHSNFIASLHRYESHLFSFRSSQLPARLLTCLGVQLECPSSPRENTKISVKLPPELGVRYQRDVYNCLTPPFGLDLFNSASRVRQSDVEMADNAASEVEEAHVQHLLVPSVPQPLTDFQNPVVSKPLPHLPPSFQQAGLAHSRLAQPALSLNNVPFMFHNPTDGHQPNIPVQAPLPRNPALMPRNDSTGRLQRSRSRSRSRSPLVLGPPSPKPVEANSEVEPPVESGNSKIRLVGIEDPQKDALIASLTEQLSKSNELLRTFEAQLREVKADTAALKGQTQNAEARAKKAEKDLADQKLKSDERLRDLEKKLKDDASQQIILAEKRAQSMLLDLKGLSYPPHSTRVQQNDMPRDDAMVIDWQATGKGKKRAGEARDNSPLRLLPPVLPGFSPLPLPLEHPQSKEQATVPSSPTSGDSSSEPPKKAQSLPKPLKLGRPKSNGQLASESNNNSDNESDHSSSDEDDEEQPRSSGTQSNIQGLDTDELLKLLLTTLGVNGPNLGLGTRRRRGHIEFKDPVKRRANTEEKTKLMNWLRQHLNSLIGIKKTRDILNFKNEIFATDTELQRGMALWEKDKSGEGPAVKPMRINWNNLEGPWNLRLCQLFVQYCVEQGLGDGNPGSGVSQFVADYFWERLERMRTIIRKNKPKADEDPAAHSARVTGRHLEALVTARRNTRRNQIFKDRIDICLDNLPRTADEIVTDEQRVWKTMHDVVQALGPEGMSSDESDIESSSKTFLIKKLPWRNKRLVGTMKRIDKSRNVTNAYGNTRPGNSPRIRVRVEKPKKSARKKAPTGKPVDLYDFDWYEKLKYQKKVALHAKPAMNY